MALVVGASVVACRGDSGAHATADAERDPMRCASCHMPEFTSTKHPPHEGARPPTCGVCHTQSSWHGFRVDHPWYELTGAHARAAADKALAGKENQVKCMWCHRGDPATFKDTKKECVACHAEDRETATFPGHDEFPLTCEECHSTEAWKPTTKRIPRPSRDAGPPQGAEAPAIVDAGHAATTPTAPKPKPAAPHPSTKPTSPRPTPAPTPVTSPTAAPIPRPDVTTHSSRRR